jgi:hypothetical protein
MSESTGTPWWRKGLDVLVALTVASGCASVSLLVSATLIRLWFGREANGPLVIALLAIGTTAGALGGGWFVARAQYLGWLFKR